MSYQFHGTTDLVALPNRTVQTYPSGLVRVERSFVCRKDRVARFRNTIKVNEPMPFDDGAPAIDGLYIFPEPQELVRDDGFVEFRVTAYGRTGFVPPPEITAVKDFVVETILTITRDEEGEFVSSSQGAITYRALSEVYTYRLVVVAGQPLDSLVEPPSISPRIFIQQNPGQRQISPRIIVYAENFSATNFGFWNEWTYSYKAYGSASSTFYIIQ